METPVSDTPKRAPNKPAVGKPKTETAAERAKRLGL
jgi:hypothetical protein